MLYLFFLLFYCVLFLPGSPFMPLVPQNRCLTWPHSGLLSLISNTKISTSVVAWNFPSEAMTLRRYFSVSSLSRGFLEEIVHSPSIWSTVNCPSTSPSRGGRKQVKKAFTKCWKSEGVRKQNTGVSTDGSLGDLKDLDAPRGLSKPKWYHDSDSHWWCREGTGGISSRWGAFGQPHCTAGKYPAQFSYSLSAHYSDRRKQMIAEKSVMFCRCAYSLPQNHIVSPSQSLSVFFLHVPKRIWEL